LPPLKGYLPAVIISAVAFLLYAVTIIFKAMVSVTMLQQFQDPGQFSIDEAYMFPFMQGSIDVATIMLVVSGMSVIRGVSRQSTSAFRLAAVAALLHVLLVWPVIVGNLKVSEPRGEARRGEARRGEANEYQKQLTIKFRR